MLCYQQSVSQWSSSPHHPQSTFFNVALSLLTFSVLYVIVFFFLVKYISGQSRK